MAENEHGDGKDSGAAGILGKNPKQRKIAAIGIGAALLLGAVLLMRKSSNSAAGTSSTATTGAGTGTPAYGDPYGSSYDMQTLLSQYASTAQAQNQQTLNQLQGDISGLSTQLAGLDTNQPGSPPPANQPPATNIMTGPTGDEWLYGRDLGPYMYGQNQIDFMKQNIGQYGYTQSILNDVQNAYNTVSAQFGQQAANEAHYSWISNQNVQAIPAGIVDSSQIYNVHLSGAGSNAGGSIVNLAGAHTQWPTVWTQAAQPGITNPTTTG